MWNCCWVRLRASSYFVENICGWLFDYIRRVWDIYQLELLSSRDRFPTAFFNLFSFISIVSFCKFDESGHRCHKFRFIDDGFRNLTSSFRWVHYLLYSTLDQGLQSGQQTVVYLFMLGHGGLKHQYSYSFFKMKQNARNIVVHEDLISCRGATGPLSRFAGCSSKTTVLVTVRTVTLRSNSRSVGAFCRCCARCSSREAYRLPVLIWSLRWSRRSGSLTPEMVPPHRIPVVSRFEMLLNG